MSTSLASTQTPPSSPTPCNRFRQSFRRMLHPLLHLRRRPALWLLSPLGLQVCSGRRTRRRRAFPSSSSRPGAYICAYRASGCSLNTLARPRRLGSQVLVNMFNAQPFLEDCAFVPWEERKNVRAAPHFGRAGTGAELERHSRQAGVRKEGILEIRRRSGRAKPVVYQVTDKPPAKKSPVRGAQCAAPLERADGACTAGLGTRGCGVCAGLSLAAEGVSIQGARALTLRCASLCTHKLPSLDRALLMATSSRRLPT